MLCEVEGFMNGQQFKKLYEKKCEPLMKKYDLRKIDLDVLFFLSTYKTCDTAKDIASYKCLSKAHVSKAIDNLTSKNYLTSKTNQEDRRCMHLSITEYAKPVIEDIELVWKQINEILYYNISGKEQQQFLHIMNRVLKNINTVLEKDV